MVSLGTLPEIAGASRAETREKRAIPGIETETADRGPMEEFDRPIVQPNFLSGTDGDSPHEGGRRALRGRRDPERFKHWIAR